MRKKSPEVGEDLPQVVGTAQRAAFWASPRTPFSQFRLSFPSAFWSEVPYESSENSQSLLGFAGSWGAWTEVFTVER